MDCSIEIFTKKLTVIDMYCYSITKVYIFRSEDMKISVPEKLKPTQI